MKLILIFTTSLVLFAGCARENSRQKFTHLSANSLPDFSLSSYESAFQDSAEIFENPLNLQRAIETALANNPNVGARIWDIQAARAEIDIARGQRLPTVSAVGTYTQHLDDQRLTPPRRPGDEIVYTDKIYTGDIVLSMPLYTGGRLRDQAQASELLADSAFDRLGRTRSELVFNVSSVYFSILAQESVIESLEFSQETLQQHLTRVEELIDAQKAARVDLLRTEVQLANIKQRLISERNKLTVQKDILANLMGFKQSPQIDTSGELEFYEMSPDLDQSIAVAKAGRSDLRALTNSVKAQQKIYDSAKALRGPDLSLQAAYGGRWSAAHSLDAGRDIGRIGLVATVPLFEGGRIDAGITRERSRLFAAKETLRHLELQVVLDVKTALANLDSANARVLTTEKSIEQASESLRIEREKYELGKGAIIDVLDAQSSLLEVQTNYFKALADHNIAVAQWKLAIGEAI